MATATGTQCTRCDGTGFINYHQVPDSILLSDTNTVLEWIRHTVATDAAVCDCCGDGHEWHGVPGHHYGKADPQGPNGPYAYNGGLCECH